MTQRLSAIVQRLLALGFGLLFALAVTEVLLQLGAWYAEHTAGSAPLVIRPRTQIRILALGDSNTYGFGVGRDRAYPAVLERLWNERLGKGTVQVFNLGFPGTNSSQIATQVARLLTAFRPHVVTVMVGANDPWTVPVPVEQELSLGDRIQQFLWRASRVYRLLYMAFRSWENTKLELEVQDDRSVAHGSAEARYGRHRFHLGHTMAKSAPPDWQVRLETNLKQIAERVRASGAQLYFVTYPSESHFFYSYANGVMRRIAAETGAPLVDVALQMPADCTDGHCQELLPDQHPSEQGHVRTAEVLLGYLQARLGLSVNSAGAP